MGFSIISKEMWVNVDLGWQDFKLKWFQISDSSKKKTCQHSSYHTFIPEPCIGGLFPVIMLLLLLNLRSKRPEITQRNARIICKYCLTVIWVRSEEKDQKLCVQG